MLNESVLIGQNRDECDLNRLQANEMILVPTSIRKRGMG